MRTLIVAAVATALGLPAAGALDAPAQTEGGPVSGAPGRDPSVRVFKGIPYAGSASGDRRWRPPGPVPAWDGVRSGARFGPSCMQVLAGERKPWTREFMTSGEVSEDCLSLNVWTAAGAADERRPVYVFLHGGGFREGSGAVPVYDGEGLARKGLVVVTVNYRLGVLGFLAHPELTAESAHGASGNYGLLDAVAALAWVKRNIAAFGGDPDTVTVGGQSAGGIAVHALVASPLARGLFQRAIVESGQSTVAKGRWSLRSLASLPEAEAAGARFARSKRAVSVADLRAMSWEALTSPLPEDEPAPRFVPIVDGRLLPKPVHEIVAAGGYNDVPTLTGVNADELGGLRGIQGPVTPAAFAELAEAYGDQAEAFLRLYPAATAAQARTAYAESSRDRALVGLSLWARERARTSRTPAWLYLWTHPLPGPDAARFGAFHTSEVPYVMNALAMSGRPFTAADHEIADRVSSYWARFVATGDPNGPGLPAWPAAGEEPDIMELGDGTAPLAAAESAEKRAFFEAFFSE